MITPAYSPTATERVLPRLALDFTTALTDPRVATARAANTATRINASGIIEIVNANLPRYDFDPVTLVCRGQLIEEARTNRFLNSLIDGTNLATQSVTLTAVAFTLSFYGSGSIAISGGHSATVDGLGDYPARKTYTFTPTAGSTTFTVTGDVKYAQLEEGVFVTSFVPTAGAGVLRNADAVSMTGTNFSDWYNATEGTFRVVGTNVGVSAAAGYSPFFVASDGTNANRIRVSRSTGTSSTLIRANIFAGNVSQFNLDAFLALSSPGNVVLSYKASGAAYALNAGTPVTNGAFTVPTVDKLNIGIDDGGLAVFNGWVQKISYWPQQLTTAEVRAFSK